MTSGVYSLECGCGKIYIGGSKDIKSRLDSQRNEFKNPNKVASYNSKRHKHFRECPECGDWNKVKSNIIEECSPEEVGDREDYYVVKYDSVENGLNVRPGGMKGFTTPEETKQQISESLKGRVFTEEHKRKIGESRSGVKHPLYGKKHKDSSRKKTSESLRGVQSGEKNSQSKVTEEVVRKIKIDSKDGMMPKSIFEKYKDSYPSLTYGNVRNIVSGRRWKQVVV